MLNTLSFNRKRKQRLALGANRSESGAPPCSPAQAWRALGTSPTWSGIEGSAAIANRLSRYGLCVYLGTGQSAHSARHSPHRRPSRSGGRSTVSSSSAYASPCLWVLPGEQKYRYACDSALSGPSQHPACAPLRGLVRALPRVTRSVGIFYAHRTYPCRKARRSQKGRGSVACTE